MTAPVQIPICVANTVASLGEVFIDGVTLHVEGAWNCLNPTPLWIGNAVKGENRAKPRARGRRPNRWRTDQSEYSLPMLFDGTFDVVANDYASDPLAGLKRNVRYFYERLIIPTSDATLYLTYETPDGDVLAGDVQPRTLEPQSGVETAAASYTLGLIVVDGYLDSIGS